MFVKCGVYGSLLLVFFFSGIEPAYALDVTITARVHGCGDNILDEDEQCDGNPITHNSCSNLGFSSGNLSCTNACNYDTSSCSVSTDNTSSSYFGSSVATYFTEIFNKKNKISDNLLDLKLAKNSVIFEGDTSPNTEVTLTDDFDTIIKTTSDSKGKYLISISNVSKKNNIFTLSNDTEKRTFIVNMYSNNIIKYNNVSLQSLIKLKINSIIREYEQRWNVDLTKYKTKLEILSSDF